MLEKNKDYVEFTLQCTTVERTRDKDYRQVCFNGYSDYDFPGVPMDVVCKEFDHRVVMVSKRDFEQLQTENEQLKKKLEEFSPVPGYREFLTALYPGEDVEKLVRATEQLCCGRDLRHALQVDLEYYRALSSSQAKFNKTIFELIGFYSIEEIRDYLNNEAEADTLHEAILKLKDQVKYTCDEWISANKRNNSWKAAAECNSPKELMEKIEGFEKEVGIYSRALNEWKEITGCPSPSAAKTLIESGASWMSAYHSSCEVIKTWKKLTGCPTPIAAKTLIESGMAYEHGYHEVQEENRKLADDVESWKNVTGFSTPESFLASMINNVYRSNLAWQEATYCSTPEEAKELIGNKNGGIVELKNKLDASQEKNRTLQEEVNALRADYSHLLLTTGFESEGEIEDALDKWGHSTLRKAFVDCEFDYEALIKLTGYKSEHDIRVMLNDSEQFVYENMRELINSLKRKLKFTDSNWQKATGCDTPEMAEEKLEYYKDRLRNAVQAAGIAEKHLTTIKF